MTIRALILPAPGLVIVASIVFVPLINVTGALNRPPVIVNVPIPDPF